MLKPAVGRGTVVHYPKRPIGIKLCPDCVKADTLRYGEPYWHRSHNVDGVHYCWIHGVELHVAETEYYKDNYKPLEALKTSTISEAYLPGHSEATRQHLTEFARRAHAYLDGSVRKKLAYNFETLGREFFSRIYPFGAVGKRIDMASLERAFVHYFGEQFLEIMDLPIELGKKGNWFRTMFVDPVQLHRRETRKHIVMSMFIDDFLVPRGRLIPKAKRVLDKSPMGPWICRNPAARHFGAATLQIAGSFRSRGVPMTIFACECGFEFSAHENSWNSDGQPVRVRIRSLGNEFAEKCKDLRNMGWPKARIAQSLGVDVRVVSQILQGGQPYGAGVKQTADGSGRHAQSTQVSKKPPTVRRPRVNHQERDKLYADKVRGVAAALKNKTKIPAPKSRVQKDAGISHYLLQDLRTQYPLTVQALNDVAVEFGAAKLRSAA